VDNIRAYLMFERKIRFFVEIKTVKNFDSRKTLESVNNSANVLLRIKFGSNAYFGGKESFYTALFKID